MWRELTPVRPISEEGEFRTDAQLEGRTVGMQMLDAGWAVWRPEKEKNQK